MPAAPVHDVAEALADPQIAARELVVETEHPRFGLVRQVATPARVGSTRITHRRAPQRNEDQLHVLEGILGYPSDLIAALRDSGGFGP